MSTDQEYWNSVKADDRRQFIEGRELHTQRLGQIAYRFDLTLIMCLDQQTGGSYLCQMLAVLLQPFKRDTVIADYANRFRQGCPDPLYPRRLSRGSQSRLERQYR